MEAILNKPLLIAISLIALVSTTASTPEPGPTRLPLKQLNNDITAEMFGDPILEEVGGRRFAGQILLFVEKHFDTSILRQIDQSVGLISESPIADDQGRHRIVIRLPEEGIDADVAAISTLPGVLIAKKHLVFQVMEAPNDPEWEEQKALGLALLELPRAGT